MISPLSLDRKISKLTKALSKFVEQAAQSNQVRKSSANVEGKNMRIKVGSGWTVREK